MNEEQIEQVIEGVPKEALAEVWKRLTSELIKQAQHRQAVEGLAEESNEDFEELEAMMMAVAADGGDEDESEGEEETED